MIRTAVAYQRLSPYLGSKIISRGRTLHVEGQPTQVFSQTLLLIPPSTAAALNISDAETYIDKKTKEEFVALVISQTKPRTKLGVRVPVPPPNPMMEWRPVLGQGAMVKGDEAGKSEEVMIVCPAHSLACPCREFMHQAQVKLIRTNPLSAFRYGQIVSQLEAYEENDRIHNAIIAVKKTGCAMPNWTHLLAFVPATEADSIKLVSHSLESGVQIQISATQAKTWRDDDSSIHSTIPLNAKPSTKPVAETLALNPKLKDALDIEFDEKFREFDKTFKQTNE